MARRLTAAQRAELRRLDKQWYVQHKNLHTLRTFEWKRGGQAYDPGMYCLRAAFNAHRKIQPCIKKKMVKCARDNFRKADLFKKGYMAGINCDPYGKGADFMPNLLRRLEEEYP